MPPTTNGDARTASERALGAFALLVAAVLGVLVAYSVHASLPSNALTLPLEGAVDVRALLPQGWGYFSGDARQPIPTAYVHRGGSWQPVADGHQGTPRLLLGLDRSGRLGEQEIAFAQAAVPDEPHECREADIDCLEDLPVQGSATNPLAEPTLCGDVGIVRRDVLPWAWSHSAQRDRMPATAVRVEMSC